MARKTRRPRIKAPAPAASETAADEAVADPRSEQIEDAEIVGETGAGEAPFETSSDAPPLDEVPVEAPTEPAPEVGTVDEDARPGAEPAPEPEAPDTHHEIEPEATPPLDAVPVAETPADPAPEVGVIDSEAGDDTVPPEDTADIGDLARMDGAEPDEMESAAASDEAGRAEDMDGSDADAAAVAADEEATTDEGSERFEEAPTEPKFVHEEREGATPPPLVPVTPPQSNARRGPGFLPLVLGGLVAGAIGYAIPTFLTPGAETVDPAALAALEARIDALPVAEATDLTAIETAQAELSNRIDALAGRIDVLEARPETAAAQSAGAAIAVPSADTEALAALRAELDGLAGTTGGLEALPGQLDEVAAAVQALSGRVDRIGGTVDGLPARVDEIAGTVDGLPARVDEVAGAVDGLPARIAEVAAEVDALAGRVEALPAPPPDLSGRVATLESDLAALVEETEAVEVSAEELARQAAANQLRIAVDSGVPYAEPLAVLGPAPIVLVENQETGLPTAASLAAAFPEASRAALREARAAQPEAGGGLGAFLRRQTGARSLEPREGDDADAVLSRAEAAIRSGDVAGALAEVETLPPEAQDAMSGWIAEARTRAEALDALPDYLGTE